MTRPTYETEADRAAELAVIEQVKARWGVDAAKLPSKSAADFAILRRKHIVGFAEVKTRRNPRDAFGSYMLSADKFAALEALYRQWRLPVLLVVRWADGVGWMKIEPARPFGKTWRRVLIMGGRTDRGDAQDVEPVILIPVGEFRELSRVQIQEAAE